MSRAAASGAGTWFDHLPFVLLGMRTSIREDSQCCPANLLYGAPLRLPGDTFTPSTPVPAASDFVRQLRVVVAAAAPMPVLHHGSRPSRVDPALRNASHVFLRVDAVRRPLVPPYLGPFDVLERNDKTFVILQNGKPTTVTIDRLKPASPSGDVAPTSSAAPRPPNAFLVDVSIPPAAPPSASAPPTRSGRHPRPVIWFQA